MKMQQVSIQKRRKYTMTNKAKLFTAIAVVGAIATVAVLTTVSKRVQSQQPSTGKKDGGGSDIKDPRTKELYDIMNDVEKRLDKADEKELFNTDELTDEYNDLMIKIINDRTHEKHEKHVKKAKKLQKSVREEMKNVKNKKKFDKLKL